MKTNNLQINNGSICPRKYMEIEVEPTHLTKVIIMMVLRSTQKSVSNIDSYLQGPPSQTVFLDLRF